MAPDLSHLQLRKLWQSLTIDCGPGWHELIYQLDEQLSELDPDYKIIQVKEKFGGLRYYYDSAVGGRTANDMFAAVIHAEKMSFKICEETGLYGVLMVKNGWRRTLNPEKFEPEGWTKF